MNDVKNEKSCKKNSRDVKDVLGFTHNFFHVKKFRIYK